MLSFSLYSFSTIIHIINKLITLPPYSQLPSPVIGLQPVLGNHVVCVRFVDPAYDKEFPARRLEGAQQPPRVLKPGNLSHEENRNWRPQIGKHF